MCSEQSTTWDPFFPCSTSCQLSSGLQIRNLDVSASGITEDDSKDESEVITESGCRPSMIVNTIVLSTRIEKKKLSLK